MQIEHDENGGSEQPSCSDVGQILAIRKILEKEIEPMVLNIVRRVMKPMVIATVQQVMEPVAEDLFRRVVKEEIQSVEEKLLAAGTTRNVLPKERNLHLKFLDEVCDTVQTGKELKGTNDECVKLALLDANEHIVTCGSESSAKVEILLLDDSVNDDGNSLTLENFETRIITAGDKEKPHFAKSVYINLKNGIGNLIGLKLGHGEKWTKLWNCRLGARIAQNLPGTIVQEAWTAPLKVEDKRGKHYKKHRPPKLSSEVWRLDQIARKGEPCNRLENENIKTLQDFLFWFYVNPKGLQEILHVGDSMWKTIVTHAKTCIIDDKRMFSHKSSTEPQMRIIYDAVGKLKGLINESHFVRNDNLSAEEKDHARTLLSSVLKSPAFGERYNTDVEASLLYEIPYRSSDISTSTNSSLQHCPNSSLQHCSSGSGLTLSENISGYQTTEQGSSSQCIDPSNFYDSVPSDFLGSKEMGELCNPASGPFPDPKIIDGGIPTVLCTLDYEKHETPSLFDEVSRLVNICKDGDIYKNLRDSKINSVEDFLIQLLIDHEGLRKIVNLEREEWEATVSNARACSINSRMYCYTSLGQKKGVLFNVLGDILGLCFNNYCYPTSMLSERDKADAQELLASACKNWTNVKPFNDMNHLQQQLTGGASEMVEESSSRRSNASFHIVSSTMENGCYDDDMWGLNEWHPGPPSPNPMLHYADDTYSYNTQIYGHQDEPGADEGSGAASAEPQNVDPPNRLCKLFRRLFSLKEKEKEKIDATCSGPKKRKVG